MDLPKPKSKKKILQIMYPAPYSQTWEPDVLPVLMKKNMLGPPTRGPKSPKTKKGASGSPRAWSQQFPDRPDPTLPHLKYGVFRNRRGPAPYSQSWEPGVLPMLMKKNMLGPARGPKTKRGASGSPRTWSQQFPDRPDPTVPHHKNSVFRNRRGPAPRSILPKPEKQPRVERFSKDTLPKSMSVKQTHKKKITGTVIRIPRVYPGSSSSSALTLKQGKKKADMIPMGRHRPFFVNEKNAPIHALAVQAIGVGAMGQRLGALLGGRRGKFKHAIDNTDVTP